eukprot:365939-Chlamydomonas_euryale.AAC.10
MHAGQLCQSNVLFLLGAGGRGGEGSGESLTAILLGAGGRGGEWGKPDCDQPPTCVECMGVRKWPHGARHALQ